jgi:hypothetical protein
MLEGKENNKIKYIDVCRRLIHFSIRQHVLMEDPLPLVLVSQSANKILIDLCRDNLYLANDLDIIALNSEMDNNYKNIRRPYNALKHADKEKSGVDRGNYFALNEAIIIFNIVMYLKLGGIVSAHIIFFYVSGYALNPDTYSGMNELTKQPKWLSGHGPILAQMSAKLGPRATRKRVLDAYRSMPAITAEFEQDNAEMDSWIDFVFSQNPENDNQ